MLQISLVALSRRNIKLRKVNFVELQFDGTTLGNSRGVGEGIRNIGKGCGHLLRRLHIKGVRFQAHPVIITHAFLCLHAKQDFMGFGIVAVQIMAIVGGNKRNAGLTTDPDQGAVDQGLVGNLIVLQFQVKITATKDRIHPESQFCGFFQVLLQDRLGYLSAQTSRQGNQAFGMGFEQIMVDARTIIEAFCETGRNQLHQIAIADIVFCQ